MIGVAIDAIMEFLVGLVEDAVSILPDSPFASVVVNLDSYSDIMGYINYVIPVGTILGILTIYLSAVLIWYGVRWLLRFAQYID